MNELETMARAKMYLEKLSWGINPLTDEQVSENELICNVKISRCLSYASSILAKVIDSGGTAPRKPTSNIQFFITDEQKLSLRAGETSAQVKDIAAEINRVTAENASKKLQAAWINSWLIDIGMLEFDGDKKRATAQGNSIGITSVERISDKFGKYYANTFSPEAQTFVYDNIDAVIANHLSADSEG